MRYFFTGLSIILGIYGILVLIGRFVYIPIMARKFPPIFKEQVFGWPEYYIAAPIVVFGVFFILASILFGSYYLGKHLLNKEEDDWL